MICSPLMRADTGAFYCIIALKKAFPGDFSDLMFCPYLWIVSFKEESVYLFPFLVPMRMFHAQLVKPGLCFNMAHATDQSAFQKKQPLANRGSGWAIMPLCNLIRVVKKLTNQVIGHGLIHLEGVGDVKMFKYIDLTTIRWGEEAQNVHSLTLGQ